MASRDPQDNNSVLGTPLSRRRLIETGAAAGAALTAGAWAAGSRATAAAAGEGREVGYVCNSLDDTISVIDISTDQVVHTIHLDYGPKKTIDRWPEGEAVVSNAPMNAAFAPDKKKIWVPNSKGRNIAVVDVATHSLDTTIELPMDPCDVYFTPDGSTAVASLIGDTIYSQGGIVFIDVASRTPGTSILAGTQPEEIAMTPDGKRVYSMSKSLWVFDVETQAIEREIYLPYRCYDVVVTPDGAHVFASSTFGGNKIVIVDNAPDTKDLKVSGTIDVNEAPVCMAFSHDGKLLYVTSYAKNTVQIVDLATKQVTKTVEVPTMPAVMALNAAGDKLYVAHNIGDSITVLDASSLAILTQIKCGDQPNSVTIAVV